SLRGYSLLSGCGAEVAHLQRTLRAFNFYFTENCVCQKLARVPAMPYVRLLSHREGFGATTGRTMWFTGQSVGCIRMLNSGRQDSIRPGSSGWPSELSRCDCE